jgi:hypothetical protein
MYFTTISATRAAMNASSAPVSAVSLRILFMRSEKRPTLSVKSARSAISSALGLLSSKRLMYSASNARRIANSEISSSGSASKKVCTLSLILEGR